MEFINGWTAETTIARIKERNTGRKSVHENGITCIYHDKGTDNHCAVGCFIPEGHPGMNFDGGVHDLLYTHPDLEQHMPMTIDDLKTMQMTHDGCATHTTDMHNILTTWINAQ